MEKFFLKKDSGKIDEVHKIVNLDDLPGSIGIGHTRWATHGAPLKVNSHPHSDCTGEIVVVHNGIIENFMELKSELQNLDHTFVSKTDTEVIPHLIEQTLKENPKLSFSRCSSSNPQTPRRVLCSCHNLHKRARQNYLR